VLGAGFISQETGDAGLRNTLGATADVGAGYQWLPRLGTEVVAAGAWFRAPTVFLHPTPVCVSSEPCDIADAPSVETVTTSVMANVIVGDRGPQAGGFVLLGVGPRHLADDPEYKGVVTGVFQVGAGVSIPFLVRRALLVGATLQEDPSGRVTQHWMVPITATLRF
jgi:hypothetical protein